MEAKEAPDFPEKVYIPRDPEYPQFPDIWWERESDGSNIEYTRTDAFIKKACEWLRKGGNGWYLTSEFGEDTIDFIKLAENFKKYMEGE